MLSLKRLDRMILAINVTNYYTRKSLSVKKNFYDPSHSGAGYLTASRTPHNTDYMHQSGLQTLYLCGLGSHGIYVPVSQEKLVLQTIPEKNLWHDISMGTTH